MPLIDRRLRGLQEGLTEHDRKHVELFCRFLKGERTHEVIAWACDDPMSSANDPEMAGMGC